MSDLTTLSRCVVLQAIASPMTTREIAERTRREPTTLREMLLKMEAQGHLARVSPLPRKGRHQVDHWVVTRAGRAAVLATQQEFLRRLEDSLVEGGIPRRYLQGLLDPPVCKDRTGGGRYRCQLREGHMGAHKNGHTYWSKRAGDLRWS